MWIDSGCGRLLKVALLADGEAIHRQLALFLDGLPATEEVKVRVELAGRALASC